MESSYIITWIVICLGLFFLQQSAAGGYIGNRSYSVYYEVHFLVKKSGLCKLIYFKPRHFGRYTLYEVFCFFYSYLQIILTSVFGILLIFKHISEIAFLAILLAQFMLCMILHLFVCIANDIGSRKDEKYKIYPTGFERQVANLPLNDDFSYAINKREKKILRSVMQHYNQNINNHYFTIYNLKQSYNLRINKAKSDKNKIEDMNTKYISYFKNLNKIQILKENKDGTLVISL